jgi:hypothetical protein
MEQSEKMYNIARNTLTGLYLLLVTVTNDDCLQGYPRLELLNDIASLPKMSVSMHREGALIPTCFS